MSNELAHPFPWRELHELQSTREQSLEAECSLRILLQSYPPAPPGLSIVAAVAHVLAAQAAEIARLRGR